MLPQHWVLFVNVQSIESLEALLTADPELAPPPYILVGHSAGGQMAMHFAQTYSNKVAGLALLDRWVKLSWREVKILQPGLVTKSLTPCG